MLFRSFMWAWLLGTIALVFVAFILPIIYVFAVNPFLTFLVDLIRDNAMLRKFLFVVGGSMMTGILFMPFTLEEVKYREIQRIMKEERDT